MKKLLFLITAFAILFTAACKKDEPDEPEIDLCPTTGTFSVEINDTLFTATSFANTLVKLTDQGTPGKRFDLRATNAAGDQMVLTFTNVGSMAGDCMDTGPYVAIDDIVSSSESAYFVTYFAPGLAIQWIANEGSLQITACDPVAKTISGTFTFEDDSGPNSGTVGTFSNVCYTTN